MDVVILLIYMLIYSIAVISAFAPLQSAFINFLIDWVTELEELATMVGRAKCSTERLAKWSINDTKAKTSYMLNTS